jgi:hypothetical protein
MKAEPKPKTPEAPPPKPVSAKPAPVSAKPAPAPVSAKPAPAPVKPAPKPAPAPVRPAPKPAPIPALKSVAQRPAPRAAPTTKAPLPDKGNLTFSGPPNTNKARVTPRDDYSHNSFQLTQMEIENEKLCERLVKISAAPVSTTYVAPPSVGIIAPGGKMQPANVAAASINRRKKEDKIAQENLALYKRLQAVKPSKDTSREVLNADFNKSQIYGTNARKIKDPEKL